uniref:Mitochondrial import inner membrane translocase subunit TIM50 n=1 Tax=Tanacetum cinerariifolium TaxID=118510 RepID=A0A699L1H3_TANCI|nr:Dullard phosphatase domain, eukaryotic [Tanacetum cinerariifolium]
MDRTQSIAYFLPHRIRLPENMISLLSIQKVFDMLPNVRILYRDSCKSFQGNLVEDLSGLGWDLKNVVIVDDDPRYMILQRKNAIQIRPFTDDLQDHELKKLMNDFFKECNRDNNLKDAMKHYRRAAQVQHKRD